MTSFKKAGRAKAIHPRGTKPSLHNSQLLISSGTPSLDALLGNYSCVVACALVRQNVLCSVGGLAIGTVLLVGELYLINDKNLFSKKFCM